LLATFACEESIETTRGFADVQTLRRKLSPRFTKEHAMIVDTAATRCAHAPCTCHAQEGEQYCSESCRNAAEAGSSSNRQTGSTKQAGAAHAECSCGHASCAATSYASDRKSGGATQGTASRSQPRDSDRSR
jgi:hypothetical protein